MSKNANFADDAALLQLHHNGPQRLNFLQYWWKTHIRAFLFACGELVDYPMSSLITLLVIGIAFALPISLFSLLQNAETAANLWQSSTPKIQLYLKQNLAKPQLDSLVKSLQRNPSIEKARYISPQEGLKSLKNNIAAASLDTLGTNPLPGVIEITPNHLNSNPQFVQTLYEQLKTNPLVEITQLNMHWVKRLYYVIEALRYLTAAMALLFCIGLVLIVGNTIRLDIKGHREQIQILQLIGATKAYIRRPLLYRALLYGVIGSVMALAFSEIILWQLQTPVSKLALTYNNQFELQGLTLLQTATTICIGGLLSYVGARLVVNYFLQKMHE